MRLRFQDHEADPVLKRNIPITGVDAQRALILVNHANDAWPYELAQSESSLVLKLQLYASEAADWRKVRMVRSSTTPKIANTNPYL
jgi:hypothetical protein